MLSRTACARSVRRIPRSSNLLRGWKQIGLCFVVAAQIRSYLHADQPSPLSLDQAQSIALQKNWDQLAADLDVAIANAQRDTAREYPNPTLSASSAHIATHGGNQTALGGSLWDRSYDTIVSFSQPLEVGGKRGYRYASSEANYEAVLATRADLRRNFIVSVVQSYVSAALAQEIENLTNDSAAHLEKEAELARVRFQSGDIAESDLSQIEIAAQQFKLQAGTARANALASKLQLSFLLGREKPEQDFILADELDRLAERPAPEIPVAEVSRPDLVAALQNERKAEQDLRLQKAQRMPDPTVLIQYEHQPPDLSNTVGIGVSLPLPLWNRNKGAIRAAALARDQADLGVAKRRAQIASEIAAARKSYEEASSRWTEYKNVIRPRADRVRESVSLSYEKGSASLLDLLQAQRSDNDVRLAAAQAAADTIIARAALQAAVTESPLHHESHL